MRLYLIVLRNQSLSGISDERREMDFRASKHGEDFAQEKMSDNEFLSRQVTAVICLAKGGQVVRRKHELGTQHHFCGLLNGVTACLWNVAEEDRLRIQWAMLLRPFRSISADMFEISIKHDNELCKVN